MLFCASGARIDGTRGHSIRGRVAQEKEVAESGSPLSDITADPPWHSPLPSVLRSSILSSVPNLGSTG